MLLAANLNGGNLLLEQQADMTGVLSMLIDRKVTHAVLVPTVLQRLLALPECRTADWSALSYVVYGASPIPLPVLRDATEIIVSARPARARAGQCTPDHSSRCSRVPAHERVSTLPSL